MTYSNCEWIKYPTHKGEGEPYYIQTKTARSQLFEVYKRHNVDSRHEQIESFKMEKRYSIQKTVGEKKQLYYYQTKWFSRKKLSEIKNDTL